MHQLQNARRFNNTRFLSACARTRRGFEDGRRARIRRRRHTTTSCYLHGVQMQNYAHKKKRITRAYYNIFYIFKIFIRRIKFAAVGLICMFLYGKINMNNAYEIDPITGVICSSRGAFSEWNIFFLVIRYSASWKRSQASTRPSRKN